jgi:sugar phosphate isomerase/epimerase
LKKGAEGAKRVRFPESLVAVLDGGLGMLLLSTGSLYTRPLRQVFAWAAEAGFEGMELLVDARAQTRDLENVRRCMEESGLPVPVVHMPFHSKRTPEWGSGSVERVLATARLARELGAALVVLHLPLWHEHRFACWLREELPGAERELGLTLAVENLPANRWLLPGLRIRRWPFLFRERRRPSNLSRLLLPVTRPDKRFNTAEELATFGHVVFDTCHWAARSDLFAVWEVLKRRVVHIHLANGVGTSEHRLPWDGEADLGRFLRKVKADGYAGHLTAELCPEALGDPDEDTVRRRLAEAARWFKWVASSEAGGGGAGGASFSESQSSCS